MKHLYFYLYAFIFIILVHYYLISITVFTYPEVIQNKLGFSPFLILFGLEIPLFVYLVANFSPKLAQIFRNYVKYSVIWLFLIWLVFISLTVLESLTFDNFVFSKFHINLISLGNFVNFSTVLFILYLAFCYYNTLMHSLKLLYLNENQNLFAYLQNVAFMIIMIILSLITISNFRRSFPDYIQRAFFVISNATWTYDQKMEYVWDDFYLYMKFIKASTPDDAIVAIPPADSHWLSTGNSVLVRYFLFPREVIGCAEINCEPPSNATDIMLAKGFWSDHSTLYGWPKVEINSSSIHYIDLGSGVISSTSSSFSPDHPINQNSWGIISR